MLKYMVVLAGLLVVLAASDEAQARGFRRSRGTCPNGQCSAPIAAAPEKAVATNTEAGASVAEAPAVEAPEAAVTANVAVYSNARVSLFARFFQRR